MQINPIAAPTQANQQVQARPIIKMDTNANPTYLRGPEAQVQSLPDTVKPSNISPNEDQTSVDEANQPISPQFAALAKQRRALQVKERALAEREKALTQPQTGGGIDLARLKSQPLDVLLEAGVTYEQLTEAILNNQGNSEIHSLKQEIAALKDGVDKKLSERDQQAEKQVLAEMQREATNLAAQDNDFELVRETKSVPDVMKLIERTYRETGEVLEVREAMTLVEDELFKEAQRMVGFKKLQDVIQPQVQQQLQRPQMRTLTNRDTATLPMSAKQRALAAFNGTLKR